MNPRRIAPTLGTAVGTAVAAALIGLAPVAGADPDPFEDLLGDYGVNTWTPSADASLNASDPSLAASLYTSVEAFKGDGIPPPFENIVDQFDPTAYSTELINPATDEYGYFPVTAVGDFATLQDYSLYASGLESTLGTGLLNTFEWGEAILLSPFLLIVGLAGG